VSVVVGYTPSTKICESLRNGLTYLSVRALRVPSDAISLLSGPSETAFTDKGVFLERLAGFMGPVGDTGVLARRRGLLP